MSGPEVLAITMGTIGSMWGMLSASAWVERRFLATDLVVSDLRHEGRDAESPESSEGATAA